jgi:hypothetical protein
MEDSMEEDLSHEESSTERVQIDQAIKMDEPIDIEAEESEESDRDSLISFKDSSPVISKSNVNAYKK